jgi:uncharacterized protein YcbX
MNAGHAASTPPNGGRDWERAGAVVSLHHHPVKSMGGVSSTAAEIGVRGVESDRRWAVVDRDTGAALSAKRHAKLLQCAARDYPGPDDPGPDGARRVTILLPDGATVRSDDARDAADKLSTLLARPVALVEADRSRAVNEFPDDGSPGHEGDSEHGGVRRVAGLRGMFADAAPLHLITTGTLGRLASPPVRGDGEPSRFRANVVIAGADEQSWVGHEMRIGTAEIAVTAGCPRCVMIGLSQPGVSPSRNLLRDVVRHEAGLAGVYAKVLRPGRARVGGDVWIARAKDRP